MPNVVTIDAVKSIELVPAPFNYLGRVGASEEVAAQVAIRALP